MFKRLFRFKITSIERYKIIIKNTIANLKNFRGRDTLITQNMKLLKYIFIKLLL